jgi:hypothetical protein
VKRFFAALILTALVALPLTAFAEGDYMEMLRQDIRAEKTALLTEHLKLTEADSKVFWPIQRQFELELAKIYDARLAMIKEYVNTTEALTPAQAKSFADRAFKFEGDRAALKKKYFADVSKKLNPVLAARYMQLEVFLETWIDTQIQGNLPAIK